MEFFLFFFFKQKTAYEIASCLVGSEMCIRDRNMMTMTSSIFCNVSCTDATSSGGTIFSSSEETILRKKAPTIIVAIKHWTVSES